MRRTTKSSDNPIFSAELTRVEAAKLLRTSPSFISKLEKIGALRVKANNKFALTDLVIQWGNYKGPASRRHKGRAAGTRAALESRSLGKGSGRRTQPAERQASGA